MLINDILKRLREGLPGQRDPDRYLWSVHESAHACAYIAGGAEVRRLTASDKGGLCRTGRNMPHTHPWRQTVALVAGTVACEQLCNFPREKNASDDEQRAYDTAREIHKRSPHIIVTMAYAAAETFVRENRTAIERVAVALDEVGILEQDEIRRLAGALSDIPWPPKAPRSESAPATIEVHRRVDGWVGGAENSAVRRALVDALRSRDERQKLYAAAARNVLGACEG
jgi:hypothetical protein